MRTVSDGGARVEIAIWASGDDLMSMSEPQRRAVLDGLADLYAAVASQSEQAPWVDRG